MAIVTFNENNFQSEVVESKGLVLVDFWATWCGPCKMFAPVLDELDAENIPDLKIGKVDVDENQGLAGQFRVMTIPTVAIFKDGTLVSTSVGVKSKKELMDMIENLK